MICSGRVSIGAANGHNIGDEEKRGRSRHGCGCVQDDLSAFKEFDIKVFKRKIAFDDGEAIGIEAFDCIL